MLQRDRRPLSAQLRDGIWDLIAKVTREIIYRLKGTWLPGLRWNQYRLVRRSSSWRKMVPYTRDRGWAGSCQRQCTGRSPTDRHGWLLYLPDLSGGGLARRALKTWPRPHLPNGLPSPRTAQEVFAFARSAGCEAKSLIYDAGRALAMGLGNLVAVIDPAIVVIGGTLGLSNWQFVRAAARRARQLVILEARPGLGVVPAGLADESVFAGATVLAV